MLPSSQPSLMLVLMDVGILAGPGGACWCLLVLLVSLLGVAGCWSPFVRNCFHRSCCSFCPSRSLRLILVVAVVGSPCRRGYSSVALVHAAAACCSVLLAQRAACPRPRQRCHCQSGSAASLSLPSRCVATSSFVTSSSSSW